jgi:hypothetical protein
VHRADSYRNAAFNASEPVDVSLALGRRKLMRRKIKSWGEKRREKENWHYWFAWHPVMATDDDGLTWRVWLEFVYRSGKYWSLWGDKGWEWKYKVL